MSYYLFVGGVKWYYCLIPKENTKALFSDFPRDTLLNKFVTCWDFKNSDKNTKLYTVFPSYLDFAKFFLKLPQHLRCFYEIIIGEFPQKPHFDLDMELSDIEIDQKKDETILNELVNSIISTLAEKNIVLNIEKDICIYSSHGEKKRSYHIVINFYCHSNNKEAKAFYYTVIEKLPKEYFENKWIDPAVYSKTQQFRTFKSSKSGSTRIKELMKTWKFNGNLITHQTDEKAEDEDHQFLINFEESIVSARVSNCKVLPIFDIHPVQKDFQKGNDIDYSLALEAFEMLAHKAGTVPEDKMFPYRLEHVDGPFVILKRVRPSKCKLCNRIHHNQNPYLLIVPETKNVFFHCRRARPDQKLYLGCLKPIDLNFDNTGQETVSSEDKDSKTEQISVSWSQQKINHLKELASISVKNKSKKILNTQEYQSNTHSILNNIKNNNY